MTLALGARNARESMPATALPSSVEYHLVTADGQPDVTPSLLSTLSDLLPWADILCAAGSLAFYRGLATTIREARYVASPGFAQVLYPGAFLCGTGACQACTADVAGGRRRVCVRGPVFDLTDVLGERAA